MEDSQGLMKKWNNFPTLLTLYQELKDEVIFRGKILIFEILTAFYSS